MNMKVGFRVAVAVAAIALIAVFVVLVIQDFPAIPLIESEISSYSLLVDVVVGVFTIWGLYWAASEFAGAQVKPDLRLVVGKESADQRGIDPLMDVVEALIGRDVSEDGEPVSQVIFGLFLENTQPKAAQYVRVTLRVRDVPRLKQFVPIKGTFRYKPKINVVRGEAIFLQFGDDLVVYKGDGVQLGNIRVAWPQGTHPERITLVAGLYGLEDEPKEVTVSRPIHWM
jgi:hypothetical protein